MRVDGLPIPIHAHQFKRVRGPGLLVTATLQHVERGLPLTQKHPRPLLAETESDGVSVA